MERPKSVLTDMDGVLVRGRTLIPGAREFLARLVAEGRQFLVMTNNSLYPPAILQHRLARLGLEVPAERIHTSARPPPSSSTPSARAAAPT